MESPRNNAFSAQFDKMTFAVIAVFVVMLASLFTINYYSDYVKTGVKGYVQGSLIWSNAQKRASYHLKSYLYSQKSSDYRQFLEPLDIIRGDRQAALTLISEQPDYQKARQGFIKGNINEEYIGPMIWLVDNFKNVDKLAESIEYWKRADQNMQKLTSLAGELQEKINRGTITAEEQQNFAEQIDRLNRTLTGNVQAYVGVMNEAERWINSAVFWINSSMIALLVLSGAAIVMGFIRRARQWDKALAESEARFRHVLEHTRDVIYQLDFETGRYEYISPYIEKQLGFSAERVMSEGQDFILDRIHPEDLERLGKELKEAKGGGIEGKFSSQTEFRIKRKDGTYIWANTHRTLVTNQAGEPVAIVGSVRDISDRKRYEVETEKSLKEKRTLLEEIHHRVKNNLAIVSGILELQKYEPSGSLAEALEDTQSRIQSIAKVHEKLYQTETLSDINICEYVDEFSDMIARTYRSSRKNVTFNKDLQSFSLNISRAVPLGLIFNELLNNAFKHGFADIDEGEITIRLKKLNDKAVLSVSNDGKPLPEDFVFEESQSLGFTLVKALVEQLDGDIDISQNEQTKFAITFPV